MKIFVCKFIVIAVRATTYQDKNWRIPLIPLLKWQYLNWCANCTIKCLHTSQYCNNLCMLFQNVGSNCGRTRWMDRMPTSLHKPQSVLRYACAAQEESTTQLSFWLTLVNGDTHLLLREISIQDSSRSSWIPLDILNPIKQLADV